MVTRKIILQVYSHSSSTKAFLVTSLVSLKLIIRVSFSLPWFKSFSPGFLVKFQGISNAKNKVDPDPDVRGVKHFEMFDSARANYTSPGS